MARTGKHRIYRFSNNYSPSVEPVVYNINGAKLTTIKEFRGGNTNVPATLDSAAFPSSSNQAPPLYSPGDAAQGPMIGSSVQTSPTATKRRLYSVNMNQVYLSEWDQDATTQELSNITRAGAVTIPAYWSTLGPQSNLLHAEIDPIIKWRVHPAMSYLSSSALGEKLYFPLGTQADKGLAALTLNSDDFEASTWEACETDLRSTYGQIATYYQHAVIFAATSDKYVTVSMWGAGIAFYNTSSLEWLGQLQLPTWQNKNMAISRINIQEFGGKKYLAATVAPYAYSGSLNTNKIPKMLLYDIDAIDPADLAQDYTYSTPANTAVPIGVIFGSGSIWVDDVIPPRTYGYGDGRIPGSEIYISGEGDPVERIGCAIPTKYWTEIYDISHLIIEDSITAGDENPASITSSYSALTSSSPGTKGLDIVDPDNLATLSNWLDTFAVSRYPYLSDDIPTICGNEGPPAGARARHSYGEQFSEGTPLGQMSGYGGTCWAGSYIISECIAVAPGGFAILSMESSSVSLSGFKVNWGGLLRPHLGMPAMLEPYNDLNFISSSNPLSGGWVAGSVRAATGTFVSQLPPENDLSTINLALHRETATPWTASCGSASWEPTGASGLLPDGEYYSSSYYRYWGANQATAMLYSPTLSQSYKIPFYFEGDTDDYMCAPYSTNIPYDPALDPDTVYKSAEVNMNSTLAWNTWVPFDYPDQTPPTLAEFSGYGGVEIIGGDVHVSDDPDRFDDILFISDRASNATYALSANPGSNCVMLDKTGWLPSSRDCAVASASIDGKTWVANASGGQKWINFSYWDDNSKTFDTNLTISSSFFKTAICYRSPGYGGSHRAGQSLKYYGMLGIRAPIQGTNPVELSDTVNHIWQSLSSNPANYFTSFDISLTPISDLEDNLGSANDKGFVEVTSSLSRYRRVSGSTAVTCSTLVHYGTESFDSLRGKFIPWGAKQVGKYVISFLNEYDTYSSDVVAHYVGVHELTWSQDTGTGPEGTALFVTGNCQYWTTAGPGTTQGAPTQEILVAKPIRVIPLTDFIINPDGEGNIITVSPNEDYVAASNTYGTYLLYMGTGDLSSSAGYPKPVAGLSMWKAPSGSSGYLSASDGASTMWRGWRMGINDNGFGGNISTGLSGAMWNDRVGKAPAWPLVDINGTPFAQLEPDQTRFPPTGSPANPGQTPFAASHPNTSEFRQEGDNLYFYVQTDPLTMWLVLTGAAETYAATPCNPATDPYGCSGSTQVLEFVSVVGEGQARGRARISMRAGENIYWFGDMGGWTT